MNNELLFWAAVFAGAAGASLFALAYAILGAWLFVPFQGSSKK